MDSSVTRKKKKKKIHSGGGSSLWAAARANIFSAPVKKFDTVLFQ